TVTGVVTSPCFGATDHTDYYIQDATAGINLFKYYDYTELDIGDEVQVMGEIDQYRGKTEIIPLSLDDIVVLSTGNDFDTTGVTIPDFGEFIEGLLVELEEVWLVDPAQWPSPGSWANVDITDGTDTLILYIDSDTDVDEMDAPTYNFALVGIGTQYTYSTPPDDGYEIMPRFQADFTEIVGIDELADLLPTVYDLHQNYPNPFNPNTTIKFDVVDPGHLSLKVYNILGQEVTTLVDQQMEPGFHSIRWNATGVATGVYFYRIEVNDFVKIRKMVLLK
ncbi:T9SS type A sorting domain-containing protein, partial [candidate division KSB1 bacterium]|nr:T9SS type A sorting domain-containing protein [candidate division KSB1 bacterium]